MTADARRPFYGYWIVLAAFLCNIITFGCGFYAFSLFVTPLQQQLGWGRGDVMAGFTIFFLTTGFVAPEAGRMVDRDGARVVMAAGAAIAGIGFVVLFSMSALWEYYLGYAIVGLGMAGTGQIPTSAVTSNWFEKRRGTMVGLMASGVGVGGLVLAPVVGTYLLPTLGWSKTFLVLGILCWAVIIPLAILVMRTRPEEKGLRAYGATDRASSTGAEVPVAKSGVSLKVAAGTMTFWLIVVTFLSATSRRSAPFRTRCHSSRMPAFRRRSRRAHWVPWGCAAPSPNLDSGGSVIESRPSSRWQSACCCSR